MESQVQQPEYVESNSLERMQEIQMAESENLPALPTAQNPNSQLQLTGQKISYFLASLPEYIGRFFQEYKLPIISFALLVVGVGALRILVAVLDAINDIPLVSPFLELIGIGYTIWFTNRYLLKAETREELAGELRLMSKQILGTKA